MSTLELVDAVLAAAFGAELPERIVPLVDRDLAAELIEDFKLGPIFPLGRSAPPRIAVSNQSEQERWRRAVLEAFPNEKLERFLDSVPADTRRMIDTDGHSAIVYLDDLQDVEGGLKDSTGRPLMFITLNPLDGRLGSGTRHSEPPRDLLDGVLREHLEKLLSLGAAGLWSLRWEGRKPSALVWVSESRWRKNPDVAIAIGESLGTHPGIEACARAARDAGYVAYPDAIEARGDGTWDLTVGFTRALSSR